MKSLKPNGRLWLRSGRRSLAGRGRIELLRKIDELEFITHAAHAMKMSYKAAWDAVDATNSAVGEPLVENSTGGKLGDGMRLAATGQRLIEAYEKAQKLHRRFLVRLTVTANAVNVALTASLRKRTCR